MGVTKFISQSTAYAYDPRGIGLANEKASFWRDPPCPLGAVLSSIQRLESTTLATHGTVLRFGHLYGPGTSFTGNGWFFREIQACKMSIIGDGSAVFSFTHVRAAAAAVVAALTSNNYGVYNIVDDWPAEAAEWLSGLA